MIKVSFDEIIKDNCGSNVVTITISSETRSITRYLGYCPVYGYFFVSGNIDQEWSMGQSNFFDVRNIASKEIVMQILRGQLFEAISQFLTGCYISDLYHYLQDQTGVINLQNLNLDKPYNKVLLNYLEVCYNRVVEASKNNK